MQQCEMTSNRKADQKSSMRTKLHLYGFSYTTYTSPQPLFDFINVIIVNHNLSQWFPVQSPHTIVAILFCDITKPEEVGHAHMSTYICIEM